MVALDDDIKEVYRFYHVPGSNFATGLIVFENDVERAALARASQGSSEVSPPRTNSSGNPSPGI